MPASEKTWRDLKTLHVVFGFTGLLLLISTVWMFAADHSRQWKRYQRTMRKVDIQLAEWNLQNSETNEKAASVQSLDKELKQALGTAPDQTIVDEFIKQLGDDEAAAQEQLRKLDQELRQADLSLEKRQELREALVSRMTEIVRLAKFEEDTLLSQRKFQAADFDERRAQYDLAVRDNKLDELPALQAAVDEEREARDELTRQYQDALKYRESLQDKLREIEAPVQAIREQQAELQADYERFVSRINERTSTYFTSSPPFLGKKWLELPILDAFNSPLKIDNRWTENLEITNGSFGTVRRFDRCTTCHQAIDKTDASTGSPLAPQYPHAHEVVLRLETPTSRPVVPAEDNDESKTSDGDSEESPKKSPLSELYGFDIAASGLVSYDDVTVRTVLPNSAAANATILEGGDGQMAGLRVGDVLLYVNDDKIRTPGNAEQFLTRDVKWGEPVTVRVRRGLPHPFSTHPRLDLFVGSLSPHKLSVFGCSVCHEGQGSATDFKWASHTPNDPIQEEQWAREYGWFDNHHWIYPMQPSRFAESSCLKCHHDVVELAASESFEQPPAPKLMEGYNLVRQYGCYGCHEINGYKGPDLRIGPDLRLEPNYYAAAEQLKADPSFSKLDAEVRDWVEQLVMHPERDSVRHRLLENLTNDAVSDQPTWSPTSRAMSTVLADVDTPGTQRKSGPSLRHIAQKVSAEWMYDWLREPKHFRPSTRMPQFFGQWDHLSAEERAIAEKYEPIEILSLVTYLQKSSQPIELEQPASQQWDDVMVERGKVLFETRGCLACHQHQDFPVATADQGPDLTNIGDKFAVADTPDAQTWLYTWLKNPSLYHPRTKMPNLYLDPITDAEGNTTDPAADIAAYLLNSRQGWQPAEGTREALSPIRADLDGLLLEHLKTKIFIKDAEEAIKQGRIPPEIAATLDGAEKILAEGMTDENKLIYVGRKTLTKYGCYACHDVPGFEDAKPIGTGLADWGRKDPHMLAFEHINEYVGHGHGHSAHGDHAAGDETAAHDSATEDEGFDSSYYDEQLAHHSRPGFIWQKLKEPRSYDYQKALNKDSYNDRLRMPKFPLNAREREAVITFVLGLVAEPPAPEFVYHPDSRSEAIIAGHRVLEKYNCAGCHMLEPEKWTLEFPAGEIEGQRTPAETPYPFMVTHFPTSAIEASKQTDPLRDTVQAVLYGMPALTRDADPMVFDEFGDPIEEGYEFDPEKLLYMFDLWEPALIDGNPYEIGYGSMEIPADQIKSRRPAVGGDLTHWLLKRVTEVERESNPQADGKQAYGWLPPPLMNEGAKVQSDWLHRFLLNPFPIRPAVFMRMPKFNMSPQEATDLVRYFAAKANTEYPYTFDDRTTAERIAEEEQQYQQRLAEVPVDERPQGESRFDHAMNIVTSKDYCVTCHIVGDYRPQGSDRALAPDLSAVGRRLQLDYVRKWIARPAQVLPYTPMPVNVKYDPTAPNLGGVDQKLYHGTSIEQLDALVELLMNYPQYAKQHASVSDLIREASETDAAAGGGAEAAEPGGDEADTDAETIDEVSVVVP